MQKEMQKAKAPEQDTDVVDVQKAGNHNTEVIAACAAPETMVSVVFFGEWRVSE